MEKKIKGTRQCNYLKALLVNNYQCWAHAPILAPPLHWRKLKGGALRGGTLRGGVKEKKWCGGSGTKKKWR